MDTRTPPHDVDAERALIGAVLGYGELALSGIGTLSVDDFYLPEHRDAWEAIVEAGKRRESLDLVSVGAEVAKRGSAGRFVPDWNSWAIAAASNAPVMQAIPSIVRIVREMRGLRKVIELGTAMINSAFAREAFDDVMDTARGGLADLEVLGVDAGPVRVGDAMPEVLEVISDKITSEKIHYVSTGISTLDYTVGGMCPGNMIIIAARPGMGKTSLADCILEAAAFKSIPSLMFSIEMTRQEWSERMLSLRSGIPANTLRFPKGDPRRSGAGALGFSEWKTKLQPAAADLSGLPLFIDDRPLRIGQIVGEARRWRAKHVPADGLGLIVIDYAQIIGVESLGKGETRERAVARISAGVKTLGKTTGCPVILVSQINRAAEKENRPPQMSDLRESGALEQDADIIIFLHREIDTNDPGAKNRDGAAQAIVAKNKFGKTGIANLWWTADIMRYSDLAERETDDHG